MKTYRVAKKGSWGNGRQKREIGLVYDVKSLTVVAAASAWSLVIHGSSVNAAATWLASAQRDLG